MFDTPVLLIVFNRPVTAARILEQLRTLRPSKLLVAADGPRSHKPDDKKKCEQVRLLLEGIDWECDVQRLFQSENLGCKDAVFTALDWAFDRCDRIIVLEDDCLPALSFFYYCESLLERYQNNENVMMITGYNCAGARELRDANYFYAAFGGIWGWATWKRSWKLVDRNMDQFPAFAASGKLEASIGKKLAKKRLNTLDLAYKKLRQGKLDTWDYQWAFTRHLYGGLTCVPAKNLIQNIGFGPDATHTTNSKVPVNKIDQLTSPFISTGLIKPDLIYDQYFLNSASFLSKIQYKIYSTISR